MLPSRNISNKSKNNGGIENEFLQTITRNNNTAEILRFRHQKQHLPIQIRRFHRRNYAAIVITTTTQRYPQHNNLHQHRLCVGYACNHRLHSKDNQPMTNQKQCKKCKYRKICDSLPYCIVKPRQIEADKFTCQHCNKKYTIKEINYPFYTNGRIIASQHLQEYLQKGGDKCDTDASK